MNIESSKRPILLPDPHERCTCAETARTSGGGKSTAAASRAPLPHFKGFYLNLKTIPALGTML